jgi:hypothetical protein
MTPQIFHLTIFPHPSIDFVLKSPFQIETEKTGADVTSAPVCDLNLEPING